MKHTAGELQHIIDAYAPKLQAYSAYDFAHKPFPGKWSKQEVLGHLIDSAHNNLRRFIVTPYEDTPHIVYDQDMWVSVNDYQHMKKEEMILLWKLMNERISVVLDRMPESAYSRVCNTGKGQEELHPVQWLAADYVKHLKHHINEILPGSFKEIED